MPRPAAAQPAVIRVRSTADLVASVPYLVGFEPRRSVVLISLRSPRLRCGMVARVDLPTCAAPTPARRAQIDALVASTVAPVLRDEPAQVALIVHDEHGWDVADHPHQDVVDALTTAFAVQGVGLKEAAYVGPERYWSYTCGLDACCPDAGRLRAELDRGLVPASMVANGRAPLADRADLVARIAPRGPLVTRAVAAVAAREARWHGTDRREAVLAVMDDLVARAMDGPAAATPDEAGLVLAGLVDLEVRDAIAQRYCGWLRALSGRDPDHLARALTDSAQGRPGQGAHEDAVTNVLLDLATLADGAWTVAPLTLLALQCWDAGQGAMANVCLERALAADPGYRMALLADQLLRAGIAPRRADRHLDA